MSKVNLYISCAEADRRVLNALLEWLFPMKDEVNIWYKAPPSNIPHLSLPWRILLFWYRAPNYIHEYYRVLDQQRHRAHLYLFLASPQAMESPEIQADIALANERKTAGDWRSPRLFRLVAKPCRWQGSAQWAGLAGLHDSTSLDKATRTDWIELTETLDYHIKFLQPILQEVRFYRSRPVIEDEPNPNGLDDIPLPDLNDDPEAVNFRMPKISYPPEWAGWIIIFGLLLAGARSLTSERARIGADLHLKARPAREFPIEYPRENPYKAPSDTTVAWPPAD